VLSRTQDVEFLPHCLRVGTLAHKDATAGTIFALLRCFFLAADFGIYVSLEKPKGLRCA